MACYSGSAAFRLAAITNVMHGISGEGEEQLIHGLNGTHTFSPCDLRFSQPINVYPRIRKYLCSHRIDSVGGCPNMICNHSVGGAWIEVDVVQHANFPNMLMTLEEHYLGG